MIYPANRIADAGTEVNSQPPDDDLYNPATLALMTRVLDAAWIEAQTFGPGDRSVIRASMARGIIEAIEAGVTDADDLRRAALSAMHRDIDDAD